MRTKAFKESSYEAYMSQLAKGEESGFEKGFMSGFEKGFIVGFEKGQAKNATETVMHVHRVKGLSAEEISDFVGYPLDEVRAILRKNGIPKKAPLNSNKSSIR